MRSRLLLSAAVAAALLLGGPVVAQNDPKNLVTLSPQFVETEIDDTGLKAALTEQGPTAQVRPNSAEAGVYFLYVWNHKDDNLGPKATLVVELVGPKGELLGEGRAEDVSEGKWKVVKLAKPAAPPPPPAPTAAPAVAAEPPPPGVAVARAAAEFKITARVYKVDNNKKVVIPRTQVKDQSTYTQNLSVSFRNPSAKDYIDVGAMNYRSDGETVSLTLTPTIAGKGVAKLTFVGEAGKSAPQPRSGVFTRTLDKALTGNAPQTLGGQVPSTWTEAHLALDGIERVKIYPKPKSTTDGAIDAFTTSRVRVIAVNGTNSTKPGAFPVRVEVDNGAADHKLELRINRAGVTGAADRGKNPSDEVIPLGAPRDERLWVDVAEPTKGGIGFATRTSDWVKALDLTNARGKLTVMAILRDKEGVPVASDKLTATDLGVTVDADPPTVSQVTVGDPKQEGKEKLVKGKSLPLRATVEDGTLGSGVQKVTFVLYARLQDDGTFPADAVKVDAVQQPELDKDGKPTSTMSNTWKGDLTPPKADTYKIAVVAVDNAGNPSGGGKQDPAVKVIQIVDPMPGAAGAGTGVISGVVFHAGRPQPGIFVAVGGADGKAKAVKMTDERGKFCIDDLPPGAYTVTTMKPSSGKGFTGQADVTVEADDTAKVAIELVRVK